MYLDEIVAAQKRGEARGVTSVCSAHPEVIKQTLKAFATLAPGAHLPRAQVRFAKQIGSAGEHPQNEVEGAKTFGVYPLIEATCNQVNQFGGYTGMTPVKFVEYVRGIAIENDVPFENVILGGDHLGPNVWQNEPAEMAMDKAKVLVRDYVEAGFTKIHLDCSMRLADDPEGPLDIEVSATRAVQLARVAESVGTGLAPIPGPIPGPIHAPIQSLRYVIGSEVPTPGGATEHEETLHVTRVEDAQQTIEVTREAFLREGLAEAWERVIGLVVQPGVEFGDDIVHPYQPEAAQALSEFIESQPLIYEAHSTDYQTPEALKSLVRDHFAILKVGPALTFAFREAVFTLAKIEDELVAKEQRSNIVQALDDVMVKFPEHWKKYYRGDESEQAFKRKYSLSDRIRYYWSQPVVEDSRSRLMENLGNEALPNSLLEPFAGTTDLTAAQVIANKINRVLENYLFACG
jgi:D-tagatose-1,6-bisphosphate aldolase subunit GatZ/KbaZ